MTKVEKVHLFRRKNSIHQDYIKTLCGRDVHAFSSLYHMSVVSYIPSETYCGSCLKLDQEAKALAKIANEMEIGK